MSFDRQLRRQYRFDQVEGLPGKFNNLLYIPGKLHGDQFEQIVCYFGGDIQNFRDEISPEFEHFAERYCYETVGDRLSQSQFPPSSSSIIIVQPVSYYKQTYACYHNFVPNIVDKYGTPGRLAEQISSKVQPFVHLQRLIGNLIGLVCKEESSSSSPAASSIICQPIKLELIGFSKGCTVLNQLLYSINANAVLPVDQGPGPKVQLDLTKLYFLDSGHNGTSDGWITDRTVLSKLMENCPKLEQISIGVTAYQLGNNKFHNKQWLAREENTFYRLLNELNLEIKKKKNNNKNFKVTRLYLDKSDADNQTGGLLGLHFQIIDRLIEGKLN